MATEDLAEGYVDGIDVDDIAAAVLACPGVAGLGSGAIGELATYLPGRRVAGIRVSSELVELEICATWGFPAQQIAEHILTALAGVVADRPVQITIVDIAPPAVQRHHPASLPGAESEST